MKKILLVALTIILINASEAQTNTFPSSGSAGIGTLSPTKSLDMRVSSPGDGIQILSSSQSSGIHFKGNSGHYWSFYSLGSGDGWCGAGGLAIQDETGDPSYPRFLIDPNGQIGLGGITSLSARLHISSGSTTDNITGLQIDHNYASAYGYAAQINVNHDQTKAFVINNITGGSPIDVFEIWGNGVVNTKKLYSEAISVTSSAIGIYWPDYVFRKDYSLMPLVELEKYIKLNHHLPNIPTAGQVQKEGLDLYEINRSLVEKVEELSLYVIELKKELVELQRKVK